MKSVFAGYQTFLDILEKVSMFAAMMVAAALFLVTASGILFEQFTGNSMVWVEEINNLLFAWVVFLGAGIIARHGGHIGVTMLYDNLGPRYQQILRIVYLALALIIVWVMVYFGYKMARFVGRSQTSLYLDISLFYYYLSIPVGGVLLGLNSIGRALPDPRPASENNKTSGG